MPPEATSPPHVRPPREEDVRFKRSRFVARFPRGYRYSSAHYWLAEDGQGLWRIGLTHFATRMLGEIVEFDVETAPGAAVKEGEVIGWIEGMKAITDLFCVATGELLGMNPTALEDAELVCKDPYGDGWLYAVRGIPDPQCTDVETYLKRLGETLDTMEAQPWRTPGMA